jgi:hypothetical protein
MGWAAIDSARVTNVKVRCIFVSPPDARREGGIVSLQCHIACLVSGGTKRRGTAMDFVTAIIMGTLLLLIIIVCDHASH